jgi:hypothetical protein
MTSASTMVETMLKSSVRCVHQMTIYIVCNIYIFNSPSELTFWTALVHSEKCKKRESRQYYARIDQAPNRKETQNYEGK